MEILYISSIPSTREFLNIKEKIRHGVNVTTYGMLESGFKFHSLIQNGLVKQGDTHIYSLVGRSVGNRTHKGIYWKAKKEERDGISYKHLALINLPVVKQLMLAVLFFFNTLGWLIKHKDTTEKFILIDAAYVTVIPLVMLAARLGRCKTVGIFADIYEYMGEVNNDQAKHKIISKIMRSGISKCYDNLDGFVLITEKVNDIVNRFNKPYIVMEGLVDINMSNERSRSLKKEEQLKIILYAGALREKYGLKVLIEGFMNYVNEDVRLEIYGAGDYAPEVERAAKKDSRIRFLGLISNDDIVKREIQSTLLVNPRPINQEFTQYSFPSKNMEYMASGTPVLTTRLPGMPEEYYDYIFTIDGDTAEDVTKALAAVLSQSEEDLYSKGAAARDFVLKNKNNVSQAEKIVKMIQGNLK